MRQVAMLIAITGAGCGTVYPLDQVSDTTPQLSIVKIVTSRQGTDVVFRYGAADATRRIGVYPPGHEGAFVIQSADKKSRFRLTKVRGISVLPDRTIVEGGGSIDFTLTFEPIPETLRQFRVGEGKHDPEAEETSWQFLEVNLP